MIDGGSTTFHMAEYLATLDVNVVTNSYAIADHLQRHSPCTVIMPEGTVNHGSQLILNTISPDPLANYNVRRAFIGVEGITETALTNSDPLLIQMERAMIAHAAELIILADETKFGEIGPSSSVPSRKPPGSSPQRSGPFPGPDPKGERDRRPRGLIPAGLTGSGLGASQFIVPAMGPGAGGPPAGIPPRAPAWLWRLFSKDHGSGD